MSRFTPETIERVREAANIVEIVSAHTDLRKQGVRYVGLCPFHDERTPSFSVKPDEGFYYCFGCEAGGDTIGFVQEKEGLTFPDAVESLAERYGVEIEVEREDPKAEEARRRRGRLSEALQRASAFYESFLWESDKAASARTYLTEERGLGEEVLRSFGVGFAPSIWDSILTRGQRAGFSVQELHDAGLIQRSQNRPGSHYDRFRARITFPVKDHRGRVVGFGARGMGADAKPKYLNSPEGELYRKSRTLYGIDRARGPIARGGRAVVVEGYTDVLALHQAGIEEAVAVMGTAITPDQLALLAGYAEEVVLALDADRAGREAMLRAQRVHGSSKLRLLVAAMPAGEDPADMMLTEEGGARLRKAAGGGGRPRRIPRAVHPWRRRPFEPDRPRPRARRGRAGARRDGGDDHPPGDGPRGRRPPRHRPGSGHRSDARRDADAGARRRRVRARGGAAATAAPDARRAPAGVAAGALHRPPEGGARVSGAARPRALHLAGADAGARAAPRVSGGSTGRPERRGLAPLPGDRLASIGGRGRRRPTPISGSSGSSSSGSASAAS